MAKEFYSFDVDGVLVPRQIPRQFKAEREYGKYGLELYLPPLEIPQLLRGYRHEPLSLLGRINYLFHSLRSIPSETALALRDIDPDIALGINTGRPSTIIWAQMTAGKLIKANLADRFSRYDFKPEGVKTTISKIAGVYVKRKEGFLVTHFEDNPADGLPMAYAFHDLILMLIRDQSTDKLTRGVDLSRLPNVHFANSTAEAIIKCRTLTRIAS